MPQSTRVAGSRPVRGRARAGSGRASPRPGVIGGISRCQPWRATMAAGRRSAAHQRCDWAAALVTSSARTPESRQAQYCGVGRKARAAAKRVGPVALEPEELAGGVGGAEHDAAAAALADAVGLGAVGARDGGRQRLLVVDHRHRRAVVADEHAAAAVGAGDDRGDRMPAAEVGERGEEEGFEAGEVVVAVGRAVEQAVGGGGGLEQRAVGRHRVELGVGLADVEDRDDAQRRAPAPAAGATRAVWATTTPIRVAPQIATVR